MNKAQEEANARFRDSDILMLTYFTYLLITKLRISKNTNCLGEETKAGKGDYQSH